MKVKAQTHQKTPQKTPQREFQDDDFWYQTKNEQPENKYGNNKIAHKQPNSYNSYDYYK
jgi:hypothetical protein